MAQFKVGDTVKLKSGGPVMTVGGETMSKSLECHWFNQVGSEFTAKFETFNPEMLKQVDMNF
jgi:uncharacterized protein YodC (DUF2158 family)